MLRRLQDHPRILELAYGAAERLLGVFRPWLRSGTFVERLLIGAENISKIPVFDCRMCGQCVLHSTGMTCPMTCPKNLRNGPCGGVRPDGRCEVVPEMACVWVQAWNRSQHMTAAGMQIARLLPPLDHRLHDTSAWVNHFSGAARRLPSGWRP